MFPNDEESHN